MKTSRFTETQIISVLQRNERGWIADNPAAEILDNMPRQAKTEKRRVTEYLTLEQVRAILRVIAEDIRTNPKRRAGRVLLDVIRFAVSTGLRRGEICSLRWSDVQVYVPLRESTSGVPHYGWISVRRDGDKLTKTGDEDRVPLVATSYDALRRLHESRSRNPYVFERPRSKGGLDPDWLTKIFRDHRKLADLPDGIRFHSLRHTCASWLAEKGADLKLIQEILRHSSINQTMRYTHLMPKAVATKAVTALDGIRLPDHVPPCAESRAV
jgi:integrase